MEVKILYEVEVDQRLIPDDLLERLNKVSGAAIANRDCSTIIYSLPVTQQIKKKAIEKFDILLRMASLSSSIKIREDIDGK